MTSEYRHQTIAATFLAVPQRLRVLEAELVVYAVAGVGYGVILSVSAAVGLYGGAALNGTAIGAPVGYVAAHLIRLAVAAAAYMVIGVGVGAIVRNQLVAVGVLVGPSEPACW
ncbi:MAG: hypothetical protein WAW17_18395 [Rhodococcus sp. (in: high G+C Gram-positive bacteria)]|uniref:hypothetical protein n=1 Tax=Rhodococcus sp. TaxID=1831 RepID=UPI003BB08D3C